MIKLPSSLTTVTPFSKLLAGILFVTFIVSAFFAGMKYQRAITLIAYQQSNLITSTPSPIPVDTSGWKTYKNDKYGFEIKYPKDWDVTTFLGGGYAPAIGKEDSFRIGSDIMKAIMFNIRRSDGGDYSSNSAKNRLDNYVSQYPKEDENGNIIRKFIKESSINNAVCLWFELYYSWDDTWKPEIFCLGTNSTNNAVFYEIREIGVVDSGIFTQILSTFKFTP